MSTVVEDFEDSTFNVTITNGGNASWARATGSVPADGGTWAFKAGTITHSQTTDAIVTKPSGATLMAFDYRVSSEANFDFLKVIGNPGSVELLSVSGNGSWTQSSNFTVTSYTSITFRYQKDDSVSNNSDTAWIDNLTFTIPEITAALAMSGDTEFTLGNKVEVHGALSMSADTTFLMAAANHVNGAFNWSADTDMILFATLNIFSALSLSADSEMLLNGDSAPPPGLSPEEEAMPDRTLNDLFYAFLKAQLPAAVVTGSEDISAGEGLIGSGVLSESSHAFGNQTAPTTATDIATTTPSVAGLYKYTVRVGFGGTAEAAGTNLHNFQLTRAGSAVDRFLLSGANAANTGYGPFEGYVQLNGSQAVAVRPVANATAATIYYADITLQKVRD